MEWGRESCDVAVGNSVWKLKLNFHLHYWEERPMRVVMEEGSLLRRSRWWRRAEWRNEEEKRNEEREKKSLNKIIKYYFNKNKDKIESVLECS